MKHTKEVVLKSYPEWDMSMPTISPRSRLYRLEPIGIGTPYVESLTSYVARLAGIHHISPKILVMKEIFPALDEEVTIPQQYSRLNNFWLGGTSSINGSSSTAKQWVEVLETLTTCDNLAFLTMLTWTETIAPSKLNRLKKAWCSQCYEEWKMQSKVVYEPLLWGLDGIDMCPRHQQPLDNRCPRCQAMTPFLTQSSRPGYCSRCACWLGNRGNLQGSVSFSPDGPEFERQLWVGKSVGDLLATAPHLSTAPAKEQVAKTLDICLAHYARGNVGILSRMLGLDLTAVLRYLRAETLPTFERLLHMCHTFSISPLEFLTTSASPPLRGPQYVLEQLPTLRRARGHFLTEEDIRTYRLALEKILTLEDVLLFPTLSQVVKKLGCKWETLQLHCADLCQAISARQPRTKARNTHEMAKHELENALKSSEPVSLKSVCKRIGWDQTVIKRSFPDLSKSVVSRYRNRFDYQRYRMRLLEELAREGPTPTVGELAKELRCHFTSLRNWFPDEFYQLIAKRRAEQQKGGRDRVQTELEELEQVMVTLQQQNIYPSADKVRSLLSDPFLLYRPEGLNKWREILEKLGYSKRSYAIKES